MLDPRRLDATTPLWLPVAEQLVDVYRKTSAEAGLDYYQAHRAAKGIHAPLPDLAAETGNRDAVRTSLIVCGPVAIKHATGQGATLAEAVHIGETRAEAAAARHVLNGGRDSVHAAVDADAECLGFVRVTDADPCWLCAMQASRGPVFLSEVSAVLRRETTPEYAAFLRANPDGGRYRGKKFTGRRVPYHDGCQCTAEPLYSYDAPWPGTGREFDALWQDATKGRTGADARRAFRRAVAAASPTQSADARRRKRADARRAEAEQHPPLPEPDTDRAGTRSDVPPEEPAPAPEPDAAPAETGTGPGPLGDLSRLSDDELFALFGEHAADENAVAAITAEMDRRDVPDGGDVAQGVEELTPEQRRVEELVSQGWDWQDAYAEAHGVDADELDRQARAAEVDAHRYTGETRDEAVRRMYDEYVQVSYVAAEDATAGHMLSKAGRAADVNPLSLFSGTTARARKYASEDLLRWWSEHGRMTFTEYRAQVLGRETDRAAAAVTAMQSNGRDFI
ncbi:hypothetical protein [Stackebrandtia nassauensis]|uniref:Capsid maturation protease n=1 Tax=Stackebrandtia nassauensis (strain DSM 44728 / CIP 108903 / NRRL B-16338 / NBRC 102104 / LLR-40K-21) TaxID=446470 RepID=D3Q2E0_STANL|nr:hypothetical protein [Stackebrandtia nassauensis]ADD43873.1 hypothetical protein Snas_4224 [Stackebrandtia nassauensis DSM 44728]